MHTHIRSHHAPVIGLQNGLTCPTHIHTAVIQAVFHFCAGTGNSEALVVKGVAGLRHHLAGRIFDLQA